jgi:hypothetical protein
MKQYEKLPSFCCTSLRDSTPWNNSICHSKDVDTGDTNVLIIYHLQKYVK